MSQSSHVSGRKTEDRELSIKDVIRFFRSHWRSISLLTLLFSAIAVTLVLLLPTQYQKRASLSVREAPSELSARLSARAPQLQLPADQLGAHAVDLLQSGGLDQVGVSATYNSATQLIDVVFWSRDEGSLNEASARAVDYLQRGLSVTFEGQIDEALEVHLMRVRAEAEDRRGALAWTERQIEQSTSDDETATLEEVRPGLISQVAMSESERESLEQMREDLPRLAAETISVEVVSETETQRSRPLVALVVLALLASFAAAVALVFVRASFLRGGWVFWGGRDAPIRGKQKG